MRNVTASKTGILSALNVVEVKPETSCYLNAFGRNVQICDVEGELSKVSHDENELFMSVEGQMSGRNTQKQKRVINTIYGYQKLKN